MRDDFSDVLGFFLLLLTGEGYSAQELRDFADYLRRELVLPPGAGKVSLAGARQEQVQVEISAQQDEHPGYRPSAWPRCSASRTWVSNAGRILVGQRIDLACTPLENCRTYANWNVWSSVTRAARSRSPLGDIAQVSRGFSETPGNLYRMNGQPALTLGVSFAPKVKRWWTWARRSNARPGRTWTTSAPPVCSGRRSTTRLPKCRPRCRVS